MKIYTKTGDAGTTALYGGKRVSKDDIRIEAYGTIDELNSFLGLLISDLDKDFADLDLLREIQNRLFTIGSHLASDPEKELPVPDLRDTDIVLLENAMDNYESDLPPLKTFILPGGSRANGLTHICRTVARRAERRIISLAKHSEVNPVIIKYVNRLSDFFFMLGRCVSQINGDAEVPWVPRNKK